jgi:hypothetical protein
VYQGIQQNDIAKGFESGLGIVILAIILENHTSDRKKIITGRLIIRILINKYNYVEIEKVRMLLGVVLLTVSVSSCKDGDKKEKKKRK